jgi:hypothetical protein
MGYFAMKCPHCEKEVHSPHETWARTLTTLAIIAGVIVMYQITLSFFVSSYDDDEIRDLFLLFGNVGVVLLGAWVSRAGVSKLMHKSDKT